MVANADSTVRIVGANADAEVSVVGGQVIEATPGDAGEFVVVNGDGTLGLAAGGSGGPPSGAAGGVLGGTYPNPGFAADMATQAELNAVDGAIQTELDTKVALSGAETIAGVKTFSSDPLIPDEVYGAGWNGSLEPPTKNAVYDKIETVGGGGSGPDSLTDFNAAFGTAVTAYDQEFEAVSASLPSGWSWLNQGTATYQEHLGAGVVTMPADAGVNWRGLTRALPSESTWTATAKVTASGKYATGNYIGLLVRESSSGKFIPISRYMQAPNAAGDENVYTDRWTNATTYGAAITNATMFDRAIYFRIRRNSATSYDLEASADGASWFPLSLAYDLSAYMTPDQIGLASNFQSNAVGGFALHWFRVR